MKVHIKRSQSPAGRKFGDNVIPIVTVNVELTEEEITLKYHPNTLASSLKEMQNPSN